MAMSAYSRPSLLTIHTPYLSTKRVSTLPTPKSRGKPALKLVGGSKSTLGNMKRPIAVTQPPIAAENPTQATAAQEKNPRRDMSSPVPAFGAAFGAGAVPVAAGVAVALAAAAAAAGAGVGAGFSAALAA